MAIVRIGRIWEGRVQHDYRRLVKDELADFSTFLHGLDEDQWDSPSLCEGWRVRDVVGHICVGYQMKLTTFPVMLAKYKGDVARGSHEMSVEFGSSHTPTEMLAVFDAYAAEADSVRRGLTRVIPVRDRMTDHLIHQEDVRRPLGIPREIPVERLVAALDALPQIGGFLKSKKTVAGLRFASTDLAWTWGTGPEVRGPADSLVLAMSGRPVGLDALEGEGVAELATRIKHG
jgi:uncharacterized protein (TIGR03083 family)